MTMTDYFVPNTTFETRQDTATALTGAADEFGISQRAVRATQGGFFVREDLYDKVFGGDDGTALSAADLSSGGDDGTATVDPDDDKSDESDDQTPEDNPSSEEQTDKAPAKKSRSKK